jgi:hypothetical protein
MLSRNWLLRKNFHKVRSYYIIKPQIKAGTHSTFVSEKSSLGIQGRSRSRMTALYEVTQA